MTEQLKPCPFCGDVAEFEHSASEASVRCMGCGAQLHRSYNPLVVKSYEEGQKREKADVIAAWNTRPDAAQVRVKPLEWDYSEVDCEIWNEDRTSLNKIVSSKHWSAMPIGMRIDYQVMQIVDPRRKAKQEGVTLHIGSKDMPFVSLDEAKAAAQADYERRIRAALEPSPEIANG